MNELNRTLLEYDIAINNVRDVDTFGFEIQKAGYTFNCNSQKRKAPDKHNVMFQNDYLEETYRDFLYYEKDINDTINKLNKWCNDLITNNFERIDWDLIIYSYKPNNLENIIKGHSKKMSNEVYWKIIGYCYTSSELGHSNSEVIATYLYNPRPERHYLMNEEERAFLAELPEQLTIYRGCSNEEIRLKKLRFSWTLDEDIANFFAYDHSNDIVEKLMGKDKSKYTVIERTINKDEIVAYFDERNESEILYFPKN